MAMTYKERMRKAIRYEPVDRIPTQINYTDGMGLKMAEHFQCSKADLPTFLGNHMIRVDIDHPIRLVKMEE
jgi:hypothetical protein